MTEDGKDLEDIIKKSNFSKAVYIKKYYNQRDKQYNDTTDSNFIYPDIKHGMANLNFSFYGIIIQRCKEDSLRVLDGYGACKTNDTIDSLINSLTISLEFLDYYPEVLNYEKYFKKYIYSLSNMLYKETFTANNFGFNPALLKTNYGIVFDNSRTKYDYMYTDNNKISMDESYNVKDEEGNQVYDEDSKTLTTSSGLICSFYFYMNNSLQHYERTYKKLKDFISKIGGFGKTTFIFMGTFNLFIARFIAFLDTEEFLLSINKDYFKNNTTTNSFTTTKSNQKLDYLIKNKDIKDLQNYYQEGLEQRFKNEEGAIKQNGDIINVMEL